MPGRTSQAVTGPSTSRNPSDASSQRPRFETGPGDDLFALLRPRGLPIGNLTSQFLANAFLDPFDHFVKETLRVPGYVRYADDMRFFADSKERLHDVRRAAERFLAGLRLVFHEKKTQLEPCDSGVPFLGFVLYPDGRRRLRREGVRRFRKRLKRMRRDLAEKRVKRADIDASVGSWLSHASHAHVPRLVAQILKEANAPCPPIRRRFSSGSTRCRHARTVSGFRRQSGAGAI